MPTSDQAEYWLRFKKKELADLVVRYHRDAEESRAKQREAERDRDRYKNRPRHFRPCPEHEDYDDRTLETDLAISRLREWLHDTFGPCAWPKDHPVARAWAELEDAS